MIKDNAAVTAIGDLEGPGIGAADDAEGGMNGTIIIQDNAVVQVQRGTDCETDIGSEGEGKSANGKIIIRDNVSVSNLDGDTLVIGGEADDNEVSITIGENVTLNGVSGKDVLEGNGGDKVKLNTTKEIETFATPTPTPTPTPEPTQEPTPTPTPTPVPTQEPTPEPTPTPEPLYRVTDEKGRDVSYAQERQETTLTIRVERETAILTGALYGMQTLQKRGIETIRFETASAVSTFAIRELLEQGARNDVYLLTHDKETVAFELGKDRLDIASILKKET